MTLMVPFISSQSFALSSGEPLFRKEEIKHVEVDAFDFLAGHPMTLALEELVEKVRSEGELEEYSDTHVVVSLLKSLK